MKLMCPKCGSIKVQKAKLIATCLEKDCNYEGPRSRFLRQEPGSTRSCNTVWRDPISLTPGGYDDNS